MECNIEKCTMLLIKNEQRQRMEGLELLNKEKNLNAWRKGKLCVLRNIRNGHHQTSRDERKNVRVF